MHRGSRTIFERAAGTPLRLLAQFATGKTIERLIYRGARVGTRMGTAAGAALTARRRLATAGRPSAAPSSVFDLRPSEDQELLVASVRRFADEVVRPAAHAADEAAATPREVLERASSLGLAAFDIPIEHGGMAEARSLVTSVLIAEQLARGDMGIATALLAPLGVSRAIVDHGSPAQRSRYLPKFVEEKAASAALAVLEPRPAFDPFCLTAGAVRRGDAWELHGEKSLVPLASDAEHLLVAADVRGVGPRLFFVDPRGPGVEIEPEPAMGLRAARLSRVRLRGVVVTPDAVLGESAAGDASYAAVVDSARLMWGAMAVGAGQAVLDYVVPYCNERRAFGEPISNRQSVAFMIADIAIELEGMRLLVYRAAALADKQAPFALAASLARVQCAAKAMKIGSDGVQLLGGHGFVKEHPVERWYRDLRAAGIMEGALVA